MRQKGFAPVLIIAIIAALVGIGFWGYKAGILNISLPQKQSETVSTSPTPTIGPTTGSPTPSSVSTPTTEWKTYTSTRFSITFSYPAKYVLDNTYENTYPDQGFIHLYTQEGYEQVKAKEPRGGPASIGIGVYSNPQRLSALEWAKLNTAQSNFNGSYTTEKIAGEDAIAYTFEGMVLGVVRVLAHGNYIYDFTVGGGGPEMTEDFKLVLSTVKFMQR
jgi:hypothetical protein